MANQSDSAPVSDDNTKSQISDSDITLSTTDNLKEAKADPPKEKSLPSVFVNSEPIREDFVQKAVSFLSHPNVRGSPVIHRRSFLEKKGLTKEEIEEAFRRVPDPTPSATPSQPVTASQGIQAQGPTQALQPVPSASSNAISKGRGLHWSHAILAVGLMGASGAGITVLFKKSIIPRFKSWIRKVVLEEDEGVKLLILNTTEKAIATANTAAAALADLARTSQENSILQKEDRKFFQELREMGAIQMQEMRSMNISLHKLEGQTNTNGRMNTMGQDGQGLTNLRQPYAYGKVDNDIISVGPGISSAPSTSVLPYVPPNSTQYTELMAALQRGERPSNIRDINDQPPNPDQPISYPRIPPRPKPWEIDQSNSYGSGSGFRGQSNVFPRENITVEAENGGSAVGVERQVMQQQQQQRTWVPPQTPTIVMPEAAEAIRTQNYRKEIVTLQKTESEVAEGAAISQSIQSEVQPLFNNEEAGESVGITGELQKVTQFSESGGGSGSGSGGTEANPVDVENPPHTHLNTNGIEYMEV